MLANPLPSYLYTGFMDDDNVRAFFDAYNSLSQQMYDWFATVNLPIFIGSSNGGDQLHWLVHGIYGQLPPSMVNSKTITAGPYNTILYNQLPYNGWKKTNENTQIVTSDDVFKRILTWNFYKGDGFNFTVPWLKRRVRRFLEGALGTDIVNDQQWGVSVTFDGNGGINITLAVSSQTAGFIDLTFADIFKSAFDNKLLHMPFWANVTVTLES